MFEESLPTWHFDDAYVDFDHPNFINALKTLEHITHQIDHLLSQPYAIPDLIAYYEKGWDLIQSLMAFCRCKMSENTKNEQVASMQNIIQQFAIKFEQTKEILFDALQALSADDDFWNNTAFEHYKIICQQHKTSWQNALSKQEKNLFSQLESTNFTPLYGHFNHLNNHIRLQVSDKNGILSHYNLAKSAGILKGSSDPILRKNIFIALKKHYHQYSPLYADLLNMLQGFRLTKFNQAKVDFRLPSFEQNKISPQAIDALFIALAQRKNNIQQMVKLRAKYFDKSVMDACDLLAPSPYGSTSHIPFTESINTIKASFQQKGCPEIADFIDMMLKNRWLEAEVRENKAGGAFYTRFNALKQPRVFTSYMGTMAHMIQQAHELGHAWHYWIMRDMPSLKTEFPMALAEIASTFNEAVLRDHLKQTSTNARLRFDILWQELKSGANFMLHIPVRYDFEVSFIEARKSKILTPNDIEQLLTQAWHKWYGDSTRDVESFLPYFKLHFYKTDQYIYNYPYTVGYLISQFLFNEFKKNGVEFMDKYKAFLKDTGQMRVDDILDKHFAKDIQSPTFWLACIDIALGYVDEFQQIERNQAIKCQ